MKESVHFGPSGAGRGMRVRFGMVLLAMACGGCAALGATPAKPDFGPNVSIFSPSMPAAAIQAQIDKVYAVERENEFGSQRNAFFFLPGNYKVDVPVGFYTEVLGLGATPDSVHIGGNVHAGGPT